MCGIVGGISKDNITSILIDGLKRLEYRGYDSAGIVTLCKKNTLNRARAVGKVVNLKRELEIKKHRLIARSALLTHAGPLMASHQAVMPIRTFATILLVLCIMASLKTSLN